MIISLAFGFVTVLFPSQAPAKTSTTRGTPIFFNGETFTSIGNEVQSFVSLDTTIPSLARGGHAASSAYITFGESV